MRSSITALALLPLISAGACSVYDSSLLLPGTGGANGAGATNGNGGSGGAAVCELAVYPLPPTDAPASTRNIDFSVVMKSIDFGDDDPDADNPPRRYRTIGYDLDKYCTSEAEKKAVIRDLCRIPQNGLGVTDGPGGIDNALGIIIQFVRSRIEGFSSALYSERLESGDGSVLIRVSDYNGEPNDDQVRVETWVTVPFERDLNNAGKRPEWKGKDSFPIASTSVKDNNPADPVFSTALAYVTDGKIVAELAQLGLVLDVGLSEIRPVELELDLTNAYVVCTIGTSEYGNGYQLNDCTLAAKWEVNKLVKQLSQFADPFQVDEEGNAPPLCTKSPTYTVFTREICQVVDTHSTGNIGPATECDSISMGVRFQTEPGLRGNLVLRTQKEEQCTVEQGQPSADSCASFFGLAGSGGSGSGGAPSSGGAPNSGGTPGTGGRASSGGASSGGAPSTGGSLGTEAGTDAGDAGNDASAG